MSSAFDNHPLDRTVRNQPTILDNEICIYCGIVFGDSVSRTKEHVIGRRFVPKGTLEGQWNLIAGACGACNSYKANLEDDISSITMFPDITGRFPRSEEVTRDFQSKAAKSRSRATGKLVQDSEGRANIKYQGDNFHMNFGMVGQPVIHPDRIVELARLHVFGFFFMLTYLPLEKRGIWPDGLFASIAETTISDWGNIRMKVFAETIEQWEPSLLSWTAGNHFKVTIKRRAADEKLRAWALEWNKSYRIVGFFGDNDLVHEIAKQIPPLPFDTLSDGPNSSLRFLRETPLDENADTLFCFPSELS